MSETTCSTVSNDTEIEFDADASPPSEAVVDAVASVESTSPVALDERLYDAVDPEALDALFAGPQTVESVSFAYCGHDLVVGPGRVVVR